MSVISTELAIWDSFYVIVGTAAGALIGLQVVVLTLIAQRSLPEGAEETGAVLLTPTIVHFGATLLLSVLMQVPWPAIDILAAFMSVIGLTGAVYVGNVAFVCEDKKCIFLS